MTTVYFIRHAESDINVRDDHGRPLTAKGLADSNLVADFLRDKNIGAVFSSPCKRAVDTLAAFAGQHGFTIETVEGFRERRVGGWLEQGDWKTFAEKQWQDFSYKLPGGESLAEVQQRNVAALEDLLEQHAEKNIIIGCHGTALSTIINYFDKTYGYNDFLAMADIMPWIVEMTFTGNYCAGMRKIDLHSPAPKPDYANCRVVFASLDALKAYRFVVVFSRYKGKWLYCRAKTRDSFETAGGHIESGETPIQAAKRELYEETGAAQFDIMPLFDYSVHIPTEYSNGRVFFADIHELGPLPEYEMAETKLFDSFPQKMRFPGILPVLYKEVTRLRGISQDS